MGSCAFAPSNQLRYCRSCWYLAAHLVPSPPNRCRADAHPRPAMPPPLTPASSRGGAGAVGGVLCHRPVEPAQVLQILLVLGGPLGALGSLQLALQRRQRGLLVLAYGVGALGELGVQQAGGLGAEVLDLGLDLGGGGVRSRWGGRGGVL